MIRAIMFLTTVLLLGACSMSCSDRFEYVNAHILDTTQSVYEHHSLGSVTVEEVFHYRNQIETAYKSTQDGSVLCESDGEAAEAKFEEAENLLGAVDEALIISNDAKDTEIEGK